MNKAIAKFIPSNAENEYWTIDINRNTGLVKPLFQIYNDLDVVSVNHRKQNLCFRTEKDCLVFIEHLKSIA